MTWTTERPSQPGWYWWRRPNHMPSLCTVFGPPGGLLFELARDSEEPCAVSKAYDDTQWAGPILPPE